LIAEEAATRLRDFVREYLELDEMCVGRAGWARPVETVYLDSPDLKLFWETILQPERYLQLRLRRPQSLRGTVATLEIKQRQTDGVIKEECALSAKGVERLLNGELPEPDALLQRNGGAFFVAEHFCELMQNFAARPTTRLTYERESYQDDCGWVTLNFDRQLQAAPWPQETRGIRLAPDWHISPGNVILELKFTERFPHWFREMVERFNLVETDFCKYRAALSALGANPHTGLL
jgi:hypothetical protein